MGPAPFFMRKGVRSPVRAIAGYGPVQRRTPTEKETFSNGQ
jgi:hypothetical protein